MEWPKDTKRTPLSSIKPLPGQEAITNAVINLPQATANLADKYAGGRGTRMGLDKISRGGNIAKKRLQTDYHSTRKMDPSRISTREDEMLGTGVKLAPGQKPHVTSPNSFTMADFSEDKNISPKTVSINQTNKELSEINSPQSNSPIGPSRIKETPDVLKAREAANLRSIGDNGLVDWGGKDYVNKSRNLSSIQNPSNVQNNYSIKQDGASNEEMNRFMAGGGGSQVRAGGRSARTFHGGMPEKPDEQKAKLWDIVNNSKFPRQRQTALESLKMLEGSEQFDDTRNEKRRQFDIEENRLNNQFDITAGQGNARLGIDQQRAETDAGYKKYLAMKQGQNEGSVLNANQWHSQHQKYQNDWLDRTAPDSITSQTNDFMDAEGTQALPYMLHQYRDNPRATEMYGPPTKEQETMLQFNADPMRWAEFSKLDKAGKEQFLKTYFENQGS